MKGGTDKIQFRNNCSDSSSSSISNSSNCSATPSISLLNSQHQQLTQQPQNSSKTEMTNLTTISQTENAITSLANSNDGPSTIVTQNTSITPSQNAYQSSSVICSICDEDARTTPIINPRYNSQENDQPLMVPTINRIDGYSKTIVASHTSTKSKDQQKHHETKATHLNYDHNKTMEYDNSSQKFH